MAQESICAGSFQHHFGVISACFQCHFGIIQGYFGIIPASFRHQSGIISASFRGHFGMIPVSFRHHSRVVSAPFRVISASFRHHSASFQICFCFVSGGFRLGVVRPPPPTPLSPGIEINQKKCSLVRCGTISNTCSDSWWYFGRPLGWSGEGEVQEAHGSVRFGSVHTQIFEPPVRFNRFRFVPVPVPVFFLQKSVLPSKNPFIYPGKIFLKILIFYKKM